MFECRACAAHKAHIADLQKQVQGLLALALPTSPKALSKEDIELDQLMNGGAEYVAYSDLESKEANQLLDGTHDLVVEV